MSTSLQTATALTLAARQPVPVFAFAPAVNAGSPTTQTTALAKPIAGVADAGQLSSRMDQIATGRDPGGLRFLTSAAWVFGASSVLSGVMTGLGYTNGAPREVGVSLVFAAAGVALAYLGTAGRRRYVKNWDKQLSRAAGPTLTATELALTQASGLERGLIIQRAQQAYTALRRRYYGYHEEMSMVPGTEKHFPWLAPSLMDQPFVRRLRAIADASAELTPEENAQVGHLLWIDFNLRYRGHSDLAVEEVLYRLEQLTPEARALLDHALKDKVLETLSVHQENVHRVQRLREAFEGARAPYTTETPGGESSTGLSLASLCKLTRSGEIICPDAAFAVEAVKQQRDASKTEAARVFVQDREAAKQVAAHFEREDLRAALFVEPKATVVTVYDPDKPPVDYVVRGR